MRPEGHMQVFLPPLLVLVKIRYLSVLGICSSFFLDYSPALRRVWGTVSGPCLKRLRTPQRMRFLQESPLQRPSLPPWPMAVHLGNFVLFTLAPKNKLGLVWSNVWRLGTRLAGQAFYLGWWQVKQFRGNASLRVPEPRTRFAWHFQDESRFWSHFTERARGPGRVRRQRRGGARAAPPERLELPSLLNVAQKPPLWPDGRMTSAPGAE